MFKLSVKKIFVLLLVLSSLLFSLISPAEISALDPQNPVFICLDSYVIPDPINQYVKNTWAGKKMLDVWNEMVASTTQCTGEPNPSATSCLHKMHIWDKQGTPMHHMLMAKNKKQPDGTFIQIPVGLENSEVKIVRRITYQSCSTASTTVCNKCTQQPCRPCDPAKETCSFFQCAVDKNGENMCGDILEAAPQDSTSKFQVFDYAKGQLTAATDDDDNNNLLTVNHIQSFTSIGAIHRIYALMMPIGGSSNTGADQATLKYATFLPNVQPPDALDCVTIAWDPYGRIIDSKTLEPIKNCQVTLKNFNTSNELVNSAFPNIPTFKNPYMTKADGSYFFTVDPGTYYLYPQNNQFNFPSSENNLQTAISNLRSFDPFGVYFSIGNLYNNSSTPILELAGKAERRDMILEPLDPNYSGSSPEVMETDIIRLENKHLISGQVSHPRSTVYALNNNRYIASANADLQGVFKMEVDNSLIDKDNEIIALIVEKIPLVLQPLAQNVQSQAVKTSVSQQAYYVKPIPSFLSGFVFSASVQLIPYSKVNIIIPSMDNVVYSQASTDENGYLFLSEEQLPPFEFVIQTNPEINQQKMTFQTVDQFKTANRIYLAESNINLYQKPTLAKEQKIRKPDIALIKKVENETPNLVKSEDILTVIDNPSQYTDKNTDTQGNQPDNNSKENDTITEKQKKNSDMLILLLVLILILVIGFYIYKKKKTSADIPTLNK